MSIFIYAHTEMYARIYATCFCEWIIRTLTVVTFGIKKLRVREVCPHHS